IDGLRISAGASTVRGLIINRFLSNADGIELLTLGGNSIVGNWIGVDATGTIGRANGGNGVFVNNVAGNTISGNVISANVTDGVRIAGTAATGNVVQGNLIGTSADGSIAIKNNVNGVFINSGNNNTVGGTAPGAGNLIAFNGGD